MRADIRRYVLSVLISVPLFFAQGVQPQAAMVQTNGVGAIGIDGLPVDGQIYDIAFKFGTYNDVYGGDLFPNAQDIVDAIVAELNAFSTPPPIIAFPSGPITAAAQFLIPIEFSPEGALSAWQAICSFDPPMSCDSSYSSSAITLPPDPDFGFSGSWAVPTLTPVPLPAALPLFGSALAMLGMVGWRRKRRAAA